MKRSLALAGIILLAVTAALAVETAERAAKTVDKLENAVTPVLVTEDPAARAVRQTLPKGVSDLLPTDPATAAPSKESCPSPGIDGDTVYVASDKSEIAIDPCGYPGGPAPGGLAAGHRTIDKMTTTLGYSQGHSGGGPIYLFYSAATYTLSDQSAWSSGAGSYTPKQSYLDHVEVVGNTVRYYLYPPPDGVMYQQTDYDGGDHSAQGTLGNPRALVLEATVGSRTATLRGILTILSNDATWYGEPRFNYYSAIPGSEVPFELDYTLLNGTWQANTFDTSFAYTGNGWVDFAHPVTVPALSSLTIRGTSQVPPNATISFTALASFANGVQRDVSGQAAWSVQPSGVATIAGGVLTTATFSVDRQPITMQADYTANGATVSASKTVLGRTSPSVSDADSWPMFQADPNHTGHIARTYEPSSFRLRWQKTIAPNRTLNPVTSADGRVFVSLPGYFTDGVALFALDAVDGEQLWSKSFGAPFSINPPSYAYGNVYIQTGDHASDTWLWSFDAETGDQIFRSPHEAQWERYFAPTIYDGTVYVDGGYYGGMYAFDAFSGVQRWFTSLPQYDQWTPGVSGDYAYAYVGAYSPGLYVLDRYSGQQRIMIADPHFAWNGWSMNLAPVILEDGDAVAIHDGRILRFDLAARRIQWEHAGSYTGQPCFAHGVLYAVSGYRVVAIDPETGNETWSWSGATGQVRYPMIVTDSHLFVATDNAVYALDLLSHDLAWSYPAGGSIALGDDNLYVAQSNGTLIAIAAQAYSPVPPDSLEIRGPSQVVEMSTTPFSAFAHYPDGRVRDRTRVVTWSVAPSNYATIDAVGLLSVGEMLDLAQDVTITARYTEAGATIESTKTVHLVVGVSLPQFVERNRVAAFALQTQVTQILDQALVREAAILRALGVPAPLSPAPPDPFLQAIVKAMAAGQSAKDSTQRALDQLDVAGETPLPRP